MFIHFTSVKAVIVCFTFSPLWPGNPGTPSMPMGPGRPGIPWGLQMWQKEKL